MRRPSTDNLIPIHYRWNLRVDKPAAHCKYQIRDDNLVASPNHHFCFATTMRLIWLLYSQLRFTCYSGAQHNIHPDQRVKITEELSITDRNATCKQD